MPYICKVCKKQVDITGCLDCREKNDRRTDFKFDSVKRK